MPELTNTKYESANTPVAQNSPAAKEAPSPAQGGAAAESEEIDDIPEEPVAALPKSKASKPSAKSVAKPQTGSHGNTLASENDKSGTRPKSATPTPAATTGLGAAMAKAAGPLDPTDPAAKKATAPKFAPGSVPQKPSKGSVLSAVGQVLPKARQCLDPDDPVAKATIVFQSEGTVKAVNISGGPKGSANACITKALKGAKVSPFAQDTFSASVKVRP